MVLPVPDGPAKLNASARPVGCRWPRPHLLKMRSWLVTCASAWSSDRRVAAGRMTSANVRRGTSDSTARVGPASASNNFGSGNPAIPLIMSRLLRLLRIKGRRSDMRHVLLVAAMLFSGVTSALAQESERLDVSAIARTDRVSFEGNQHARLPVTGVGVSYRVWRDMRIEGELTRASGESRRSYEADFFS